MGRMHVRTFFWEWFVARNLSYHSKIVNPYQLGGIAGNTKIKTQSIGEGLVNFPPLAGFYPYEMVSP